MKLLTIWKHVLHALARKWWKPFHLKIAEILNNHCPIEFIPRPHVNEYEYHLNENISAATIKEYKMILKMISSTAQSRHSNVCQSHNEMQIDVFRYEPLTLSLRRFLNSFFQQFPCVLQLWRFFCQVISEIMKHKVWY